MFAVYGKVRGDGVALGCTRQSLIPLTSNFSGIVYLANPMLKTNALYNEYPSAGDCRERRYCDILPDSWIRVALLALVPMALIAGWFAGRAKAYPASVQNRIDWVYQKSVEECSAFYKGDQACIERQFKENYRWHVIQDQDSAVGPPGVPGPPLFPSPADTTDADTAEHR